MNGTSVDNVRRGHQDCAWYECGQRTAWTPGLCMVRVWTTYGVDTRTLCSTSVDNVRRGQQDCVWYECGQFAFEMCDDGFVVNVDLKGSVLRAHFLKKTNRVVL